MQQKKLGFGFMRLPLLNPDDQTSIDYKMLTQMVDTFLERGFTYFDTAYMYHHFQSELALREVLVKRHKRESFTIATKMPTMFLRKKEDMDSIFNEQLKKCGVTYFDYYMLHNLGVAHYEIAKQMDAFDFMQRKKDEGSIKYSGFSFHDTAEVLEEILTQHPEVDFVQLQINYLDWEDESIQARKCYEVATRHKKAVIVMEPVKGGELANIPPKAEAVLKEYAPNLSVPSWALGFAASLENVIMVLSGMSNRDKLLDNTKYMNTFEPFNQEAYKKIEEVVKILHQSNTIPCTACQYCVNDCPKHIPIPNYFALYNQQKQMMDHEQPTQQQLDYNALIKKYGKASDCIRCKKCERSCPQHIQITQYLQDVAKIFE